MSDWRESSLDMVEFLRGVAFRRKTYKEYRPGWDHDHCELCSAKFMEEKAGVPDTLHEGYAVTETYELGADYRWLCPSCFEFLKERFQLVDETCPI